MSLHQQIRESKDGRENNTIPGMWCLLQAIKGFVHLGDRHDLDAWNQQNHKVAHNKQHVARGQQGQYVFQRVETAVLLVAIYGAELASAATPMRVAGVASKCVEVPTLLATTCCVE
jgi:hypothetical protein